MLSSPEAAVTAWEPADFAADAHRLYVAPAPAVPATTRADLFEVSSSSGIPDAVLAPARAAAESAGYAAGWNNGNRAARDAAAALVRAEQARAEQRAALGQAGIDLALSAVRSAATQLETRAVPAAEQVEALILDAAYRIAEALVGTALADDDVRGRAAVARALDLAPADEPVVVAVSAADHAVLAGAALPPGVRLVADPTLVAGDARATSGATLIDARISAGLDRVRALLTGAAT